MNDLYDILFRNHGRFNRASDEDVRAVAKALRGIDANKLHILFETWRKVANDIRIAKGVKTRLKKNPNFYKEMSAARWKKLSTGA